MKVLWFEVTEPSPYKLDGIPIGGWQDSLERIVKTVSDIDLTVCFMSEKYTEVKVVDGVTYVPIFCKWSFIERKFCKYWDVYVRKILVGAKQIVEEYKPDLIHVFGMEWPFGQIAAHTEVPVVVHIMGSIVPCNNANYPPGYSKCQDYYRKWWNPRNLYTIWQTQIDSKNRESWERKTWKLINNYMGRTHWDESLSRIMHPGRRYFHVEEALRLDFINSINRWSLPTGNKLKLVSTGCGTYWKGPDMMLKVAKILTDLHVDFDWKVAGTMPLKIKEAVEKQEGAHFEDCHIQILGYKKPNELIQILCSSTMYVHTAYIENSPNSICEAQCLGLPIVCTNVGGIASLVRCDIDGVLVAANDPWQMADAIIELYRDKIRMKRYSESSRSFALARHNDENIKKQLIHCYQALLNNTNNI